MEIAWLQAHSCSVHGRCDSLFGDGVHHRLRLVRQRGKQLAVRNYQEISQYIVQSVSQCMLAAHT